MSDQNFKTKIETLEQTLQKQNLWIKFFAFGWMLTFGLSAFFIINWNVNADENKLELRQLSIVDENGIPRMVLGSPNPDPQIRGKRYKRRAPSTGIQFNDEKGDEIGGLGSLEDGSKNLCFDVIPKKGVPHERVCMFYSPDGKTGFLVKDDSDLDKFFERKDEWNGHWNRAFAPKSWNATPESLLEKSEFRIVLTTCLMKLPERTANTFTLSQIDGLTCEEIGDVLGVTTNNCWVLLHRARLHLRQCIEFNWFRKN